MIMNDPYWIMIIHIGQHITPIYWVKVRVIYWSTNIAIEP